MYVHVLILGWVTTPGMLNMPIEFVIRWVGGATKNANSICHLHIIHFPHFEYLEIAGDHSSLEFA